MLIDNVNTACQLKKIFSVTINFSNISYNMKTIFFLTVRILPNLNFLLKIEAQMVVKDF